MPNKFGQSAFGKLPDFSKSGFGELPIDINRPFIRNPDGSTSTESSFTAEFGGRHLLFASIVDGRRYTMKEAEELYRQGKNPPLGAFKTHDEAEAASIARSARINKIRQPDAHFRRTGRR